MIEADGPLPLLKYPRTRHLEGSGVQAGDEDLESVPFEALASRHLVVEEKMDGANSGISFTPEGKLLLQSRGHYLTGGERERHFALLKTWAHRYAGELWETLGDRYLMFGEWLYAKHTIFYTDLPHYFLEFDLYDRATGTFLGTPERRALLQDAPFVVSVHVLGEGPVRKMAELIRYIAPSQFIDAAHRSRLRELCAELGLNTERVARETDPSPLMEGLYIKVEEEGAVQERYKFIRGGFLQAVLQSGGHWLDRPILPNQLAPGVELFG